MRVSSNFNSIVGNRPPFDPLYNAIVNSNDDEACRQISCVHPNYDFNSYNNPKYKTLLEIAVQRDLSDTVLQLLQVNKVSILRVNCAYIYWTALHWAIKNDNALIVKALLERASQKLAAHPGDNLEALLSNTENERHATPLFYAICLNENYPKKLTDRSAIFQILFKYSSEFPETLKIKSRINNHNTPLDYIEDVLQHSTTNSPEVNQFYQTVYLQLTEALKNIKPKPRPNYTKFRRTVDHKMQPAEEQDKQSVLFSTSSFVPTSLVGVFDKIASLDNDSKNDSESSNFNIRENQAFVTPKQEQDMKQEEEEVQQHLELQRQEYQQQQQIQLQQQEHQRQQLQLQQQDHQRQQLQLQ